MIILDLLIPVGYREHKHLATLWDTGHLDKMFKHAADDGLRRMRNVSQGCICGWSSCFSVCGGTAVVSPSPHAGLESKGRIFVCNPIDVNFTIHVTVDLDVFGA